MGTERHCGNEHAVVKKLCKKIEFVRDVGIVGAFSALTLLVGRQEGLLRPIKN